MTNGFGSHLYNSHPERYGCPTGDCPHGRQAECDAAMAALTPKEVGYAVGDRLYVREAENGLTCCSSSECGGSSLRISTAC